MSKAMPYFKLLCVSIVVIVMPVSNGNVTAINLPFNSEIQVTLENGSMPVVQFLKSTYAKFETSILKITLTASTDNNCLVVSIQNGSINEVLNKENNVRFRGVWFTMRSRGAVTLQSTSYPNGFNMSLVPVTTQEACKGNTWADDTQKVLKIVATDAMDDDIFWKGVLLPFGVCLLIIVFTLIGSFTMNSWLRHSSNRFPIKAESCLTLRLSVRKALTPENALRIDQLSRKPPEHLEHESRLYMCTVIPVGFYYFLPTIQLMLMYLLTTDKTGDLDLCFYNFECAYPLWLLKDFNHVLSNIGYLFAGLGTFLWVYRVGPVLLKKSEDAHGIPPHNGLSYALGFAVFMEGVLSASYHVCPNRSNFHHDTCFMFIAVTLTGVKMYQARHPDSSVGGPTTFVMLGVLMLLDLLGEMIETYWFFWTFTVIHFGVFFAMSSQMISLGRDAIWSKKIYGKVWRLLRNVDEDGVNAAELTASKDVYCWILCAFLCNVGVVLGFYFGVFQVAMEKGLTFDFGSYILVILAVNMLVYFLYYLVMKWIYKERFSWFFVISMLAAMTLWGAGGYFFTDYLTAWQTSPYESRELNRPCTFYDSHDYWHFVSAGALYMTFLALEFLDIGLLEKHHQEIHVF